MKPVYQTLFKGGSAPLEEQGNCLQACLASLFELELEEVPHFVGLYGSDDGWIQPCLDWLAQRGLGFLTIPYDDTWDYYGYSLISGHTPEGARHVMVSYNGKIVHDPWSEDSIPMEFTQYWIFYALNPANMLIIEPDYVEGMYYLATGDSTGQEI